MRLKLIRYDESPTIKTSYRGDLRSFKCNNVVSTSFNPYLRKYFEYRLWKGDKTYRLNFEDFHQKATKVIFFTYLKEIRRDQEKLTLMNYPYPACFLEMEVRFIFDKPEKFVLDEINEHDCEEISAQVNLLDLAREIEFLDTFDFSILNILKFSTKISGLREKISRRVDEYPYAKALKIINDYDERITQIFDRVLKK